MKRKQQVNGTTEAKEIASHNQNAPKTKRKIARDRDGFVTHFDSNRWNTPLRSHLFSLLGSSFPPRRRDSTTVVPESRCDGQRAERAARDRHHAGPRRTRALRRSARSRGADSTTRRRGPVTVRNNGTAPRDADYKQHPTVNLKGLSRNASRRFL